MKYDFQNQIVLITGSSRGIGRQTAMLFSEADATIALHYRENRMAAEETLTRLQGSKHALFSFDLNDPLQIRRGVEEILDHFGRIDILVNNAGIYDLHPPMNTDFDTWMNMWQQMMQINLIGPAHLTYWCAHTMKEQGGGKIINVSSRGAFRGEPKAPAYGASKAGLNSFTQSMAVALAPHQIFVCGVAPGFVETEMAAPYLQGENGDAIRHQSPLGRVATPEEVAHTICFLASEETDYLTGTIVDVNGASYLR